MKLLTFLFATLFVPFTAIADDTDILFVLDASGSMRQVTAGETQIDSARKAIEGAIRSLPSSTHAGLRAYAHRDEQKDKDKSCKDTELVVPLGADGANKILQQLPLIQPKGYTPIAYSLEQTRQDFPVTRESRKVIILLSDGEETCGGDPAVTIKRLRDEGFDVTLHVVGFNVDAAAEKQLRDAAAAGTGQYFGAKDGAALAKALAEATKSALIIEKKQTTYGTDTRGGDSFETAKPIEIGKEFRLDHHQKKGQFDYFYVDVRAGDDVSVEVKTLEKGIAILPNGNIHETIYPYGGVTLNADDRSHLAHQQIIGKKFGSVTASAVAPKDGKLFVLIGNEYEAQHKEHVTFIVSKKKNGDLDSDTDASDSTESALPIEVKRYKGNHLGGPDKKDIFSFSGKKGEVYQVGFIPADGFNAHVNFVAFDEYKEQLSARGFAPSQGGRSEEFSLPEDGTYYVQFELPYTEEKVGGYTLELKRIEQTPPAPATATDPAQSQG